MTQVKDSLARLLAQEDLAVEHRSVDTAQFNVETRVLTLPLWNRASNDITDLLISHEVGHALYTPNEWDFIGQVPLQFVNVVEDIRVEKLMKRRYAGLAKTFYRGYKELQERDFFSIQDQDLSALNLADRLNIYFKVGNFVNVPFVDTDREFIDLANGLETFADSIELAKLLHKYCKEQIEKQEKVEDVPPTNAQQGETESTDGEETEQQKSEEGETAPIGGETQAPSSSEKSDSDDGASDDIEVETDTSLADALKELSSQNSFGENHYIEHPNLDWNKFVVSNKEVHDHISGTWEVNETEPNAFFSVDLEYRKFKKSSNQEVNYLVKEFECKKSAASYARATTSRTGVLDCTKLHTYKYNEDIFKKVTNLQEGKNHGLIFNLDWSGSMQDYMLSTLKQLISLVTFCRKVGIAYRVYAFSDNWGRCPDTSNDDPDKIWIHGDFSFLTLLTSDSNNSQHDIQCRNLFRICAKFRGSGINDTWYHYPRKMNLGGTPLNETILGMFQLAPQFKKESKCEKVHVINLTDGEACPLYCTRKVTYNNGEEHILRRPLDNNCFLRDRKTGKNYPFTYNVWDQTSIYVENFRDRFPEYEMISIRLISSRDWTRYRSNFVPMSKSQEADQEWKKFKSYINLYTTYTASYILKFESLDSESEFEVSEDATKTQIRNAFKKSLSGKKANKKILSSFIEHIA